MDWNYPGFTACLVSALVPSLAMMFWIDTEQYPFRGFHRFPCPCHGNSTPGSVPTQHLRSVCVRKMRLLGEPAIPMGLKAQSCSGSDSPAGSCDPTSTSTCCQRCVAPEVCYLIHQARFGWGGGSSESPCDFDHLFHLSSIKQSLQIAVSVVLNNGSTGTMEAGQTLKPFHGTNSTLLNESSIRTPWLHEIQIHSLSHLIDFRIWQSK